MFQIVSMATVFYDQLVADIVWLEVMQEQTAFAVIASGRVKQSYPARYQTIPWDWYI